MSVSEREKRGRKRKKMDIKRDWDGIQKDIILLRVFDIELQDELRMNSSRLKFTL